MTRIPAHIAIIMDGNGRWAKAHGLERTEGHRMGVQRVRDIMSEATRLGVKYLTLYTFSIENWNRPADEVAALMMLFIQSVEDEIFMKNNVRFRVIGDTAKLPPAVQESMNRCMEHTAGNTKSCMVVALSYSSKWELTHAMQLIAGKIAKNELSPQEIDEKLIAQNLSTSFMPDPDLLIRTGGELRLSNFLLWQCAYSELYFCDTYWPQFDKEAFCKAIYDYQHRERRFGKISEQITK